MWFVCRQFLATESRIRRFAGALVASEQCTVSHNVAVAAQVSFSGTRGSDSNDGIVHMSSFHTSEFVYLNFCGDFGNHIAMVTAQVPIFDCPIILSIVSNVVQEEITVVGRVSCDGEGHLNDKSVLLEGR